MQRPLLRMSFPDRAALAQEHAENLKHGRAFIKDAEGIAPLTDCKLQLVLEDGGSVLAIDAQAVLVCDSGPMRGIGVQLRPFNAEVAAKLDAFVSGVVEAAPEETASEVKAASEPEPEQEPEQEPEPGPEQEPEPGPEQEPEPGPEQEPEPEAESDSVPDPDSDADPDSDSDEDPDSPLPPDQQRGPARHERLRKLSLAQQQKVARNGSLNDRVTLERLFGKQVWEALLHNSKITVPEVARMARKGSIPRPLLELIVENNTWVQAPIVRRAILGNPRVSAEGIMKLLRMTPKHELKAIYKTTTYSAQVREAARKVLEL